MIIRKTVVEQQEREGTFITTNPEGVTCQVNEGVAQVVHDGALL